MQLDDFDYSLPEELIAQTPLAQRTASRLLAVLPDGLSHLGFADLPELLAPGDLLVLNNTKVIKARLFGRKATGGAAEILVERLVSDSQALCQVKVSKALQPGGEIHGDWGVITVSGREGPFYLLQFPQPALALLDEFGHVPLPPYIDRADEVADQTRYQTVFGSQPGAVAAPTAGLHFDAALLDQVRQLGVDTTEVTLHVGAGTFQPVRGALSEHKMHSERYAVSQSAADKIAATRAAGGRVVAVGTTVVRTLESAAHQNGQVMAGSGETELFIQPGFQFAAVDALVTNFHLPKSTLLMLVSAFAGYDAIMHAYAAAVANRYRFFSYGDAMWLTRTN